jgi:hypothetical protein
VIKGQHYAMHSKNDTDPVLDAQRTLGLYVEKVCAVRYIQATRLLFLVAAHEFAHAWQGETARS